MPIQTWNSSTSLPRSLFRALALLFLLPVPVFAQSWQPGFSFPGVSDGTFSASVNAMVYGGDPGAPAIPVHFVAGDFGEAGGVFAANVARWDGAEWSALDSGVNGAVSALLLYAPPLDSNSVLVAAGNFGLAGGQAAGSIAVWNGGNWSPLGTGMNGPVNALALWQGEIVAGGSFTTADGAQARGLARWNGSSWSEFAGGVTGTVQVLRTFDGFGPPSLLAAGTLTAAGPTMVNRLGVWDGDAWSGIGTGAPFGTGTVRAADVALLNGPGGPEIRVVASGLFSTASGDNITLWDGSAWTPLSSGMDGTVNAVRFLGCPDDALQIMAGGGFSTAGGVAAERVARWTGTAWIPAGGFTTMPGAAVNVLATDLDFLPGEGRLYAGGSFTETRGYYIPDQRASGVATWDGTAWQPFGFGIAPSVSPSLSGSITALADVPALVGLAVTGTALGTDLWYGDRWAKIGGPVAVALAASPTGFYAGGGFTSAGGVPASRIAHYSGSAWTPLGAGVSNTVNALYREGTDLYVGGLFVTAGGQPANRIARWDGAQWFPLGSGMDGQVTAIQAYGGQIYAGGSFLMAGGQNATRIARWNGSQWSSLFAGILGFNGRVLALAEFQGELYAAGEFTEMAFSPMLRIARYNGSTWSAVGSGMNNTVTDLTVHDGALYATGLFTTAGGVTVNGVARWNGSAWSAVAGGLETSPGGLGQGVALASSPVSGSSLFAGGGFKFAGSSLSRMSAWRMARFGFPPPPPPAEPPFVLCSSDTVPGYTTAEVVKLPIDRRSKLFRFLTDETNDAATAGDPIVTATGEFVTEETDLDTGGPRFTRFYAAYSGRSAARHGFYGVSESPMGACWMHNYMLTLRRVSADRVDLHHAPGALISFAKSGGSWSMIPPAAAIAWSGTPWQAAEAGTKLEMMDPATGRILSFEFAGIADGLITPVESIRDRRGVMESCAYNPDGTLATVSDGLGRTLSLTYMTAGGKPRVASVTDASGRAAGFTYTSAGELGSVTNPRGGVTTFTYDAGFALATITRPAGNVPIRNTFDTAGRCVLQLDGNLRPTFFAYEPGMTTITDPFGAQRRHEFNAALRLTRLTDEAGAFIEYTHDAFGRTVSTTDRRGGTSTIAYHGPSGLVSGRTDNSGNSWTYDFTAQAQAGFLFHEPLRLLTPDGSATLLGHDSAGNITTVTDPAGHVSSHTYNARGQVVTSSNPLGGVTTIARNADGTPLSVTDPAGNTTSYVCDAARRPTQVTQPGGATLLFQWDAADNLTSRTDENGGVTTFVYDANDNPISVTSPDGAALTFGWDANDRLVSMTDALGNPVAFPRDDLGRVVSTTGRSGQTTLLGFDARRRLVSFTDGAGKGWNLGRDAEDVPASAANPLGQAHLLGSDAEGRRISDTDPLAETWTMSRDNRGNVTRIVDPEAGATELTRDPRGLVTRVALDAPGVAAEHSLNGLGQVTAVTTPRNGVRHFTADVSGRRVAQTDPLGRQVGYGYDTRNRPTQITFPGGLGSAALTWDTRSLLTRMLFTDGTDLQFSRDARRRLTAGNGITRTYDLNGNITSENGVAMSYDSSDRLVGVTPASGKTIAYDYDDRDLPVSVTDWVGGVTTLVYDDAGRLVTITRPNGVTTTLDYDAADRPIRICDGAHSDIILTRNGSGRITAATRVTPLQAAPAAFTRAMTFDLADQDAARTHDPLGRVIAAGGISFQWDLAGRLTEIDDGTTPVAFTYDALGRVTSRTQSGVTRSYVWSAAFSLPSVAVIRDDGLDVLYPVSAPDGTLLHTISATGERRFHHYDETGNTVFVTDDAGLVTDAWAWSPYGELLARSGAGDVPFTFHGRYGVLAEGSFFLMRARVYDPAAGRFLSGDPLDGLGPRSVNPYAAFFGDPLRFVDPRGTNPFGLLPDPTPGEIEEHRRRTGWKEPNLYHYYFDGPRDRTQAAEAAPPVGVIPGTTNPAPGGLGTVPWTEQFQVWSNINDEETNAGLSREAIEEYLGLNKPYRDPEGRTFLLRWTPFPAGTGEPGTLDAWGRRIGASDVEDWFPEDFFDHQYDLSAGEEAIRRWYEPFHSEDESGNRAPAGITGARRHPQRGCRGR